MAEERRQRENKNKRNTGLETGLAATLILLAFRIPLARLLGDEGNGYLAISWEIYSIFYLVFGYGYAKAIGQLVEIRMNKGLYRNSVEAMKTVFTVGFFSSLVGAALIFLLAGSLGRTIFQTNMVEISLKLFAPLMVLNCLVGIYRGYFEGMGTEVPTRISRLVEAIITATGAFIFVLIAGNYGAKVGALLHNENFKPGFMAAGTVGGYLCGSALAGLFLILVYVLYKKAYNRLLKKDMTRVLESKSSLLQNTFFSLPLIILEVLGIKLYRLFNLAIYGHNQLKGEAHTSAIKAIGSFYGKISVLMAIAIVLILFLIEEKKKKKKSYSSYEFKGGKQVLADQLEKLFSLTLPVLANFMILSQVLLKALYQSASQRDCLMLGIGGASVLFISLGVWSSRMMLNLQLKKQMILLQLAALSLEIPIVMLLNKTEIFAKLPLAELSLGIGELVFWIIFSLGQLISILKQYHMRLPWGRMILVPIIQTFVMAIIELVIVQLLKNTLPAWGVCILAIIMGSVFHQLTKKVPLLNME